jgi:arylformamidase
MRAVCDAGLAMASTGSPRRARIETFFTCQHADQFRIDWRTFYQRAEAKTDAVRARWRHELDLAYGPSEYHRLDLYLPIDVTDASATPGPAQWPIFVFLHGGGFREGDPTLYGYLAAPYVERGIAFASVGYRLTPESYLPETYADVENALAWCAAELPSRGIDVGRLALGGHSAGAILTAQLALRDDWQASRGLPSDVIKVAVPVSGVYDFSDPSERQELFKTDSERAAASPLLQLSATPRLCWSPMLVAYGSDENQPTFGIDSQRLVDALRGRGAQAELLKLDGMTHADTADALGDASSPLFQAAVALFAEAGLLVSGAAVSR